MKERYGNCNVVGLVFLNKLENWFKVGIKDVEILRDFFDFFEMIKVVKEIIFSFEVLIFVRENVKIFLKLLV